MIRDRIRLTGRHIVALVAFLAGVATILALFFTPPELRESVRGARQDSPAALPVPTVKGITLLRLSEIPLKHQDSRGLLEQFAKHRGNDQLWARNIAQTSIEQVLKLESESGPFVQGILELMLGAFYLDQHKHGSAIEHLERAKSFGQPNASDYLRQAYNEQLVALDPENPDLKLLKEIIRGLKGLAPRLESRFASESRIVWGPSAGDDWDRVQIASPTVAYDAIHAERSAWGIADDSRAAGWDSLVNASRTSPRFERMVSRCVRDLTPVKGGAWSLLRWPLQEALLSKCVAQELVDVAVEKIGARTRPEQRGRAVAIGARAEFPGARLPELAYADSDASSFAQALEAVGFSASTLLGEAATRKNILARVIDLVSQTETEDDGLLMIYFSGHGFLDEDGNPLLVAVNSQRSGDRSEMEVVALQEIRALLSGYDGPSVIMLDTCLNNAPSEIKMDFGSSDRGREPTALISAVQPGGFALEVPSDGGLFTRALTATLPAASGSWPAGKLKIRHLEEWFEAARDRTEERASQWGVRQRPRWDLGRVDGRRPPA